MGETIMCEKCVKEIIRNDDVRDDTFITVVLVDPTKIPEERETVYYHEQCHRDEYLNDFGIGSVGYQKVFIK